MTTLQVKNEIQKVLDEMPVESLSEVLAYLKYVQHQSQDQIKFNNNIKKILTEDRGLFERLAK